MTNDPARPSKLCLACARRKLAGKDAKPCGDCVLLNVDPMARARANAAKPSPIFAFLLLFPAASSLHGGISTKPARATARHIR